MVDKQFFLYDLAVTSLLPRGVSHYLREWLDYHLAAGVEHFFLYDTDGGEDVREVLKPYLSARLVDCFAVKGDDMTIPVYNDAVLKFKFACRLMAFIDTDEFIFPKAGGSIAEVVDEILSQDERAAALAINRQTFGSNGQVNADFSRGVLERFTRRAPDDWFIPPKDDALPVGNIHVKTIANPRFVRAIINPHFAYYFDGRFAVNSNGQRVTHWGNEPVLADKIVVNRYVKSRAEFLSATDDAEAFATNDRNDVFDAGILSYRKLRVGNYTPPKSFDREDYFRLLEKFLLPAARADTPEDFFAGKLETLLTCRALAGILRRSFPKDSRGSFMEEAALRAINRTHFTRMTFAEIMMMLRALPQILVLPYPVVSNIHRNCMNFVRQLISDYRRAARWDRFVETENYFELLASFRATIGNGDD
ncbi:MAG: glycosyltransferase family 92 protein [Quinella sp. 2Q5]|nr:glycosyltransferase family 92 protein [Quinella sp. 2Q5]